MTDTDTLAVDVTGLTAGYRGVPAVRDVTLRIHKGEFVGLVGPSGSGKTTLLRALTGGVVRYAGSIVVNGRPVASRGGAKGVGYVPQLAEGAADPPIRCREFVLTGLASSSGRRPWHSRSEQAAAAAMLERLGLADRERTPVSELSGGQKQRLLIARALIAGSEVLLLDEPTSGVDLTTRRDVLVLLDELNAQGTTILLTTHDLTWVAGYLPRIVCVHGGIVADGAPMDVLRPDVIAETFGAQVDVRHDGDHIVITDALASPIGVRR